MIKSIIHADSPGPTSWPHHLPSSLNDNKRNLAFILLCLIGISPHEPLRHINIAFRILVISRLQLMVLRYHLLYQLILVLHLVLYELIYKFTKLIILLFMQLIVEHHIRGERQP